MTVDVPESVRQLFGGGVAETLVNLRRDLHRHPELSWQEEATALRLMRALQELGITEVTRVARTGLVARVPGRTRSGPAIALRGDIDALPITEATGLDFASETPGVMHACGHDVHASWAVGAARLLVANPAERDVLVILQPAEELGEGAAAVLESGALDDAQMIFGGHVDRRFDVGQVVAQAGPLAASTDSFTIIVTGAGAHGARPHESHDPIVGAAALVGALQTIVSRRLDPAEPGVVTVGTIVAGSASNVIPDRAELTGTIRATTPAARTLLGTELRRMAEAIAAAYDLTASVQLSGGTPPIVNPPQIAAAAREAVTNVLGLDALVALPNMNMGGEDFAMYMERMPGCFMRVGAREPGTRAIPAHSPAFYAAEGALFIGAAVLAECARVGARHPY
ncbi:MAG TPA: M20 family metallopeptidase [Gemmatimonadaceae bacterium]|jgi:hippurate hydrolase